MTDTLKQLREALADATPGPWEVVNTEPAIMARVTWHGPEDEEYPVGELLFDIGVEPIRYDWQKEIDPTANAILIVLLRNRAEALVEIAEAAQGMAGAIDTGFNWKSEESINAWLMRLRERLDTYHAALVALNGDCPR